MHFRAIDETSECHAVFTQHRCITHAVGLIATTIGEDWAIPTHHVVGTTEAFNAIATRTQKEVVGIVKNDLTASAANLSGGQSLHRCRCCNRHECWRVKGSMRRCDASKTCSICSRPCKNLKLQCTHRGFRLASRSTRFSLSERECRPRAAILSRMRFTSVLVVDPCTLPRFTATRARATLLVGSY